MNRVLVIALSLSIVALGGCGKALTESSAVKVVQAYVDRQGDGSASTFIGALTNLLGPEQPQPLQQTGIQRLMKEGFIQQKTATVIYSNFSGEFNGTYNPPGIVGPVGNLAKTSSFTLQTIAVNRPPRVQGSFKTCLAFTSACDVGSVNGVVQRNGPSNLTLTFPDSSIALRISLVVSLVRGQPDAMVGTYSESGSLGTPFPPVPVRFAGRVTGSDIQQEVYVYSWTDKMPKDAVSGATLKLGHLVVDSCAQLLLNSETSARAVCKTHIELTKPAKVIFGTRPTDQSMQSVFGKQPDGTWVGTQVNYSAPQYDINQ